MFTKKKDRSIKLPNNVLNFDAKNNPYLEEIQFTDAQFDDFSVNVSPENTSDEIIDTPEN